MTHVTQILSQIEHGDPSSAEQLLPLVYDELRKLAAVKLAREKPGDTLQATALVHDAYLRLVDVDKAQHWDSRGHFFAAAATAMRRILVERARKRKTLRRGGNCVHVSIDEIEPAGRVRDSELIRLDDALSRLSEVDAGKARLIELRFFAGFTIEEVAEIQGISSATAKRRWRFARAWLLRELDRPRQEYLDL